MGEPDSERDWLEGLRYEDKFPTDPEQPSREGEERRIGDWACLICGAEHPPTAPHQSGEITRLRSELDKVKAERDEARTQMWSIEDGVIRPVIRPYQADLEARAEAAEADNKRLREGIETIAKLSAAPGEPTFSAQLSVLSIARSLSSSDTREGE